MIVVLLTNSGNVHIPCPQCGQYNTILQENVPTHHTIDCLRCAHAFENPVGQVPIYVGTEKLAATVTANPSRDSLTEKAFNTVSQAKSPTTLVDKQEEEEEKKNNDGVNSENDSLDEEDSLGNDNEDAFHWVVVGEDPTWDIC